MLWDGLEKQKYPDPFSLFLAFSFFFQRKIIQEKYSPKHCSGEDERRCSISHSDERTGDN